MTRRENLIEALKKTAKSHWDINQTPVLLSNLPPLLVGDVPEYKEILGGQSLKRFIKETEGASSQYKLVEHPVQRAKVALLPTGVDYQFPDITETSEAAEQTLVSDRSSEKALIEFLKSLKKLSAEDLAEVKIPVSVLVKMLR
ncbi:MULTISPECIES: hypothetical protein [Burkholderia]|uniref:hypothetical protein n=1 Tax=Burkholderia TaxID=32008 RepID=UPI00163F1DE1|nr:MULTISPECIES: hypothetical protein [Burkholderia]MDI9694460.1 hypothetical protein [Burkholderia cenocepacia]